MELRYGPEDVMRMYERIAFSDLNDFVSFGTRTVGEREENYIALKDSAGVDGMVVEEVSLSTSGLPRVKLYDRMKALEKLERYYDLLPDAFKRDLEERKLSLQEEGIQPASIRVVSYVPRPEEDRQDEPDRGTLSHTRQKGHCPF